MDGEAEIQNIINAIKAEVEGKEHNEAWLDLDHCKTTIQNLDTVINNKRHILLKLKTAFKEYYRTLNSMIEAESALSDAMMTYSQCYEEHDIYSGLGILPSVLKDDSISHHEQLRSLNNTLYIPLLTLLKHDAKELSELKKNIDEALKEYRTRKTRFERNLKKVTPDFNYNNEAMDIDDQRRIILAAVCEYLQKHENVRHRMSFGFMNKSFGYVESIKSSYSSRATKIGGLDSVINYYLTVEGVQEKASAEDSRKVLANLRITLRSLLKTLEPTGHNPNFRADSQCEKSYGTNKQGFIMKKTEGFRKVWQRRYCVIADDTLNLSHSPGARNKVSLSLLTTQVKDVCTDKDNKYHCFTLISANKQFWFATESGEETRAWVNVINNCKAQQLKRMIKQPRPESMISDAQSFDVGVLKEYVLQGPGNQQCADCHAEDPEWFSTNLGVLVCIECSGIHRKMGVRVSRIRSLAIDILRSWELLVPAALGNYQVNEILDPTSENHSNIDPDSPMEVRHDFIFDKYVNKRFMEPMSSDLFPDYPFSTLTQHDISSVMYLYMSGYDFVSSTEPDKKTFLHILISNSDEHNLCVIEFIAQNISATVNAQDASGNTPLHLALAQNKFNCVKILTRVSADVYIQNNDGDSPYALIAASKNPELSAVRDNIVNKLSHHLEVDSETLFAQNEFSSAQFVSILDKLSPEKKTKPRIQNQRHSIVSLRSTYLANVSSPTARTNDEYSFPGLKACPNIDSNDSDESHLGLHSESPIPSLRKSLDNRKGSSSGSRDLFLDGDPALFFAQGGTPEAIVIGKKHSFPSRFKIGERIRLASFSEKTGFFLAHRINEPSATEEISTKDVQIIRPSSIL